MITSPLFSRLLASIFICSSRVASVLRSLLDLHQVMLALFHNLLVRVKVWPAWLLSHFFMTFLPGILLSPHLPETDTVDCHMFQEF